YAATAHRHGDGDVSVSRDVPRLPAVPGDDDIHSPVGDVVHNATGPRLPGRGYMAQHRERGLGDLVPYLVAGQRPIPMTFALHDNNYHLSACSGFAGTNVPFRPGP